MSGSRVTTCPEDVPSAKTAAGMEEQLLFEHLAKVRAGITIKSEEVNGLLRMEQMLCQALGLQQRVPTARR